MRRATIMLFVMALVAATSAAATAAPVSWGLSVQQRQGITSCRQDDGISDYPIDFTAEDAGCRWRKFVAIPAWLRFRLTGLRARVHTNAYYGTWAVGALAPDGVTVLGQQTISNLAGTSDSAPLDPVQVIDAQGVATLVLTGGAFAGTFISTVRSGFIVEFDDAVPPQLAPLAPPLPTRVTRTLPAPQIVALENGPIIAGATLNWGDGQRETLEMISTEVFWTGGEATAFRPLVPPSSHPYARNGRYRPSVELRDAAGNAATHELGEVVVAPPAVRVARLAAPRVQGVRKVGKRLRCHPGRWRGRPRFVVTWERRGPRGWRDVGTGRSYVAKGRDRGRRVRCTVVAIRGRQGVFAASRAVTVRPR